MKKAIMIFFLLSFANVPSFAQAGFPAINKESLFRDIKQDTSSAKYFMVATFVNYCSGLKEIPRYIDMIDSITNHQSRFLICQSSHGTSDRGSDLMKSLERVGLDKQYVYLIDASKYPTDKKDERKQGRAFRDDICPACQYSVTSGTYYVIFNRDGIIMYSGYALEPAQMTAILTCNAK
ncbi:MAG TPA: hypothetical protein VFL76_08325 [Edaphocola sp.]|nr:hypothetical protein [Edaphocola sp.]